ncbi:MAG: hypothetical protein ABUT39_00400 [Acidobacteriota bacterium]
MTDLALAFRLLGREERLGPEAGWHPSPEELTAWRDGRLSARRAARVCRHLGVCFDCPDLLLDLEQFLEPVQGETGIDVAVSWQELRRQIFAEPQTRPPQPAGWRLPPVLASLRTAYAFAAASLLAAVALSFWSLSPRAIPNLPLEVVDMPGVHRGPEPPREIRVPAVGIALILNSARLQTETGLRLEILDASGRPTGVLDGLLSDSGTVRVLLPRSLLPAGEIRLRLAGRASSEPAEEVTVRVLHP